MHLSGITGRGSRDSKSLQSGSQRQPACLQKHGEQRSEIAHLRGLSGWDKSLQTLKFGLVGQGKQTD